MNNKEIKISSLPFAREMTENDYFIINQEGTTKIAKASSLRTVKGVKGEKGDPGEIGPQGPQGPIGLTPDLSDYIRNDTDSYVKMLDKLSHIENDANNYIHPDDEDTRHVTDVQIKRWNQVVDKTDKTTFNELSNLVNTLIQRIGVLEGLNKVITNVNDPGSYARVNDVWLDTRNNVFKVKQSDGSWKIIGAAYN